MRRLIVKYCLTLSISWAFIIFILCATPGRYIPSASWLELLSFDKLVHAGVFFILCFLLFLVAQKHKQNFFLTLFFFILSVFYGVLLEYMQAHYFSERSSDVLDMIADTFGGLIALLFVKRIRAFYTTHNVV